MQQATYIISLPQIFRLYLGHRSQALHPCRYRVSNRHIESKIITDPTSDSVLRCHEQSGSV